MALRIAAGVIFVERSVARGPPLSGESPTAGKLSCAVSFCPSSKGLSVHQMMATERQCRKDRREDGISKLRGSRYSFPFGQFCVHLASASRRYRMPHRVARFPLFYEG